MSTSRVVGAVVIKGGVPAPAPACRAGRRTEMAPIYAAIETLRPGEWFVVQPCPKDNAERVRKAEKIRKWIDAHDYKSVHVYRSADGIVCVCEPNHKELK